MYATPIAEGSPFVVTDFPTAELVKTSANSFLATKISFINAMAEVCEAAGGDVVKLAEAIGHDDRIGKKFLRAGIGFGGGCLPKDIRAFMARAGELGADQALTFLREIDSINMRRRGQMVEMAREALGGGSFLGKRVAVLGATFKPDSDDVRDSPALNVAGPDPPPGRPGHRVRPQGHGERPPALPDARLRGHGRWTRSAARTSSCTSRSGASSASWTRRSWARSATDRAASWTAATRWTRRCGGRPAGLPGDGPPRPEVAGGAGCRVRPRVASAGCRVPGAGCRGRGERSRGAGPAGMSVLAIVRWPLGRFGRSAGSRAPGGHTGTSPRGALPARVRGATVSAVRVAASCVLGTPASWPAPRKPPCHTTAPAPRDSGRSTPSDSPPPHTP